MTIKIIESVILLILSLISDIRTYKIKNSITMPFIIIGAATNFLLYGMDGLLCSIIGTTVPFAVLILLYMLKMLGAGDIKLFCAIGSIMGLEFGIYSMAYSFVAGGTIALLLIMIRKNGVQRLKYLAEYFKICLLTLSLQPYGEFYIKSDGSKFRFAYAIVCGTFIHGAISLL